MLGGIGAPELIVIFAIVLLLFGGKKLPEVAKSMGSAMRAFRDEANTLKREIDLEAEAESSQSSQQTKKSTAASAESSESTQSTNPAAETNESSERTSDPSSATAPDSDDESKTPSS